jgi:predicted nucleic acid-binding protein
MASTQRLLLDACGLINLHASQRFLEIVRSFGGFWIVEDVEEECDETLRQIARDPSLPELAVLSLNGAELETLVLLAALDGMDAGEAATFAVAHHRRLSVVTDDQRAIRVAIDHLPAIEVVATATVVRKFSEAAGLPQSEIHSMLIAIETDASFAPGAESSDGDWWRRMRR